MVFAVAIISSCTTNLLDTPPLPQSVTSKVAAVTNKQQDNMRQGIFINGTLIKPIPKEEYLARMNKSSSTVNSNYNPNAIIIPLLNTSYPYVEGSRRILFTETRYEIVNSNGGDPASAEIFVAITDNTYIPEQTVYYPLGVQSGANVFPYDFGIQQPGTVSSTITLTSPNCPGSASASYYYTFQ
ncbi:MAG: hypothetical protein MUF71_07200 [Candidatus Kapabacteria bacterium]|nr:hypothetical protein [Candidatus Kapabacteria bacterium]